MNESTLRKIKDMQKKFEIKIKYGEKSNTKESRQQIGVHVVLPCSERDIDDAVERAISQGFPCVWIHEE